MTSVTVKAPPLAENHALIQPPPPNLLEFELASARARTVQASKHCLDLHAQVANASRPTSFGLLSPQVHGSTYPPASHHPPTPVCISSTQTFSVGQSIYIPGPVRNAMHHHHHHHHHHSGPEMPMPPTLGSAATRPSEVGNAQMAPAYSPQQLTHAHACIPQYYTQQPTARAPHQAPSGPLVLQTALPMPHGHSSMTLGLSHLTSANLRNLSMMCTVPTPAPHASTSSINTTGSGPLPQHSALALQALTLAAARRPMHVPSTQQANPRMASSTGGCLVQCGVAVNGVRQSKQYVALMRKKVAVFTCCADLAHMPLYKASDLAEAACVSSPRVSMYLLRRKQRNPTHTHCGLSGIHQVSRVINRMNGVFVRKQEYLIREDVCIDFLHHVSAKAR